VGTNEERRVVADAIVVAAGRSRRMAGIDKIRVSLAGRPLLAWSLDAIAAAPEVERIVVVLDQAQALEPRPAWFPAKVIAAVAGGDERQQSVAAGFRALPAAAAGNDPSAERNRVVLVHDGARPFVSTELVSAVAHAAAEHGAALPAVAVAETLKRLDGDVVAATIDRTGVVVAQTPQGLRRDALERAYAAFPPDAPPSFTDEAALLEACEIAVHVVPGEPANLKITVPDDLVRAAALLASARSWRVGLGIDSHPFGPGEPLRLGGIEIAGAPRLHGHSDGDVALHAIADALLGAAALGDLGRLFPADRSTPRGVASSELLAAVVAQAAAAGWRPTSVDLTILGARPRLGPHLDRMRDAVATLLGLDPSAAGVKASSGNLGGDEGAGRAISARVAVMMVATAPAVAGTSPAAPRPAAGPAEPPRR
jgi:2-C-methyl-D-erythritol 4-phosphate cytidylyltransferase / 2-C-methyl-D-erythritol 2,4-cyclodiphosphate synthase